MGCGKSKSKQEVATGNTVVRKNSISEEAKKTTPTNQETILQDDSKTDNAHVAESLLLPQPNQIPENTEKVVESTVEIGSKEGDAAVEEEQTVEMESERVISGDSPNQFFAAVSDEISSEYASPLPHGVVVQDKPNVPEEEEVVAVDLESQSTTQIFNETPDIILKEAEAEVKTTVPVAESSTSDAVTESSTSEVVVEKKDEKVATEE